LDSEIGFHGGLCSEDVGYVPNKRVIFLAANNTIRLNIVLLQQTQGSNGTALYNGKKTETDHLVIDG